MLRHLIKSLMKGSQEDPEKRAPGWQIRCRKCGFTEPWGKYGVRRHAAGTAYTIGWCSKCRSIRTHAIERRKVAPGTEAKSAEATDVGDRSSRA